MENNIIDIIIVTFVLLGGLWGAFKGFLSTIISLVGNFLALFITVKYLQVILNLGGMKEYLLGELVTILREYLPINESIANLELNETSLKILKNSISDGIIGKYFGDTVTNEFSKLQVFADHLHLQTIGDFFALFIGNILLNIIGFIVVFFILIIIFSILKKLLLGIINSFSILTSFDRLLGFSFGFMLNLIIISFIIGFSISIISLLDVEKIGVLNDYNNLLNGSILKDKVYFIYKLIIDQAINLF